MEIDFARSSALGKSLAASAGAILDRAGRIVVKPDLTLDQPEIAVMLDRGRAYWPCERSARAVTEPPAEPGPSSLPPP